MKEKDIKIGQHLLIDIYNCSINKTDNLESISILIKKLSKALNVTILEEKYHRFNPQGITGIAIVSASHIAIHTWPEYGYIGVDIFSCKEIDINTVFDLLKSYLNTDSYDYKIVNRSTEFNINK